MIGYIRRKLRAAWRRIKYTENYRKRFEFTRPKFGFGLYHFGDDGAPGFYSLFLFFVWVTLWRATRELRDPDKQIDAWSIDVKPFAERYVYLHWGAWYKFVYLPWSFEWVDNSHMNSSGEFVTCDRLGRNGRHEWCNPAVPLMTVANMRPEESFPFRYTTNRGEVQETTATVEKVTRRRWRWKLFRWLRLPIYKTRYTLSLSFADEMGSERGSWKGGVTGVECDYVPGEPVESALRRYENACNLEKSFCR